MRWLAPLIQSGVDTFPLWRRGPGRRFGRLITRGWFAHTRAEIIDVAPHKVKSSAAPGSRDPSIWLLTSSAHEMIES